MKRAIVGAALALVMVSTARADGPEPLRTALGKEAGGKPVVLVVDGAGLSARSADGSFSRVLVPGGVKYAAHDEAKDLVWLLRGDVLEVVDLRAPTAVAVKIATGVSQESFEISGASNTVWDGDEYSDTRLVLTWSKKPAVVQDSPVITDCEDDSCERRQKAADKKAAKKVKLVGVTWLKSQLTRPARKPAAPATQPAATKITLPAALAACDTTERVCGAADCWDEGEDAEPLCGQVEPFGSTGMQLVLVGSNDGCALYDPSRKLFAGPQAPTAWSADAATPVACDAITLDPGGTTYTLHSTVCGVTAGCTDMGKGSTLFWP